MFLNKFKFFIIVALATIGIYYFQHIRLAEFVYEDVNWANANSYHWSINDLVTISGNRLTLLTFIKNTPRIAHSINLVGHIINGLLLALLVEYWFANFGWIAGSLFISNPLATQAVAYASSRSEILALIFLLGFLWFTTVSQSKNIIRWICVALCLLGMSTTRPTVLVVAAPMFIWIYLNNTWLNILKNMKYLLLAFIISFPFIIYQYYLHIFNGSTISLIRWILVQSYATWRLLYEALTGRGLSINHPWWLASDASQIIAVICGIIVIYVIFTKKFSTLAFGLGWWFIAFSPRIFATVNLGWIREQHAYVPLAGVCIGVASLLGDE